MHRAVSWLCATLAGLFTLTALAAPATVEVFSPQGTVKGVRQVTARFSAPMVPFGDPRLVEPFEIDCPEKGTARWADGRNWVYDFEHDLPAGVRCRFRLKPGLRDMQGNAVAAAPAFGFDTGGPAVIRAYPYEGSRIEENQIFILGLDANVRESTLLANAYCAVEGINERIPLRLVKGAMRQRILDTQRDFLQGYVGVLFKSRNRLVAETFRVAEQGSEFSRMIHANGGDIVLAQCARRLPANASLRLVWGKGIATPDGFATTEEQALAYQVREAFRARLTCEKASKTSGCIPILPMTLSFTSPVSRRAAGAITLQGAGRRFKAVPAGQEDEPVYAVSFPGPFAENARYHVYLPKDLRDDSGRRLANASKFPLAVKTGAIPPLAKFPADFGIIEANAGASLPVTVRRLEGRLDLGVAQADDSVPGAQLRVSDAKDILHWLRRLRANTRDVWQYDEEEERNVPVVRAGDHSIFEQGDKVRRFDLPKANGRSAFEVMGIPLEKPGFYVVELASPRLGAALLGAKKPYYVRTGALVTNLSVHFKQGDESSLVWVTALDSGKPVEGAQVAVEDCGGKTHWRGKTDGNGLVRIESHLPERASLPPCLDAYDRDYFVTARLGDDTSFVFSNWNEGIARWRFNVPAPEYGDPLIVTTVFDRTLLRVGESVHMKHYYRRHTRAGFAIPAAASLPAKAVVSHLGSDQKYELPLKWNADGTAESSFVLPRDAKLGMYRVTLKADDKNAYERESGSFRVEAFRVPLMKAVLKPLGTPLVNTPEATLDVQVNYLSGGGASGLPVKLTALPQAKSVSFPERDDFVFANGGVTEGVQPDSTQDWRVGAYDVEDTDTDDGRAANPAERTPVAQSLELDLAGAARATLKNLPRSDTPQDVTAELEYRDPNGETLTSATHFTLWPSRVVLGINTDGWAASKEHFRFQVLALDIAGQPLANVPVRVDLLRQDSYSHRKRLIGGFYAYQHRREIKRIGEACAGSTDARGLLFCDLQAGESGNLILRARAVDEAGNASLVHRDIWVAGKDDWWFEGNNDDRMDVIPEKKRYEPGETATFQVRMPFREATALVTVEREGIIEAFVQPLSGKAPVVSLPIQGNYAPNVYVSVLAVRGRVDDVQPTALVDLGKPAFKLGIAQINVGWRAHELKVAVAADKPAYRVRDKARVKIHVSRADGGPLPAGAEVALAAVDEGLLELMPNESWQLLDHMMRPRGLAVETATAQMQVVGKRHYGRKALLHGGGGGRQASRELFDTLLKWQGRVALDGNGNAEVEVPLNDSLSAFRLVAVAHAGSGFFGTGATAVRTSQDVMLFSGLPPLVREQDKYRAAFTVRNASDKPLTVRVEASVSQVNGGGKPRPARLATAPQEVTLAAGESREVAWEASAPLDADSLTWNVSASAREGATDSLKISQKVIPAVPVRTFQATLVQLDKPLVMPVARPADAIPGRGGIEMRFMSRLGDDLAGVTEYMRAYPYTCLEQQASRAVSLHDRALWNQTMAALPAYLDHDGLVKYFPILHEGSDTLTAYLLALADEAGWPLPDDASERMRKGLAGFVQGRVRRYSALPTADLAIRKVAALEALSRYDAIDAAMTESFSVEPNLWPTSAVLDWYALLTRADNLPERAARMKEAEGIIRARLNFQGTTMGFSTERSDYLWWLMLSGDVNANRAILALLDNPAWREDIPRMVRGSLNRRQKGRWHTTVANAWGVLAMEKFTREFESVPVTGRVEAAVDGKARTLDWNRQPSGGTLDFPWPKGPGTLAVTQQGSGKPWLTLTSRAAIPLRQPFSSGFKAVRRVTAVEQKVKGQWSRGDVLRVRLDLEAQSDMTWVVVDDPIPAGASILGTGLGRDSARLTRGEKRQGWVWAAFEERAFDAFRAYYAFVPKGKWSLEYTVRLNNPGHFALPPTRVEALYAPEMFGETPNPGVDVRD